MRLLESHLLRSSSRLSTLFPSIHHQGKPLQRHSLHHGSSRGLAHRSHECSGGWNQPLPGPADPRQLRTRRNRHVVALSRTVRIVELRTRRNRHVVVRSRTARIVELRPIHSATCLEGRDKHSATSLEGRDNHVQETPRVSCVMNHHSLALCSQLTRFAAPVSSLSSRSRSETKRNNS